MTCRQAGTITCHGNSGMGTAMSGKSFTVISESVCETVDLGAAIGRQLKGGELIGVSGPLGSGKTHLIKGIASGAGAGDGRYVTSPTFVIINQYEARLPIYHIDAYRLKTPRELEMAGFDELCSDRAAVLIEWADKVEQLLRSIPHVDVEISLRSENSREIRLCSVPDYMEL